jgi:hypothetical protein
MIPITLNIAGELHHVLFDGKIVSDPLFPKEPISKIVARCCHVIDQETLVKICEDKLKIIENK